jgi:adenylate kinase family enzyme
VIVMPQLIFLIGLHGCGKSSIGKCIQEVDGWRSYSVGDLGRSARRNRPVEGISIRTLVRLGQTPAGTPMSNQLAQMLIADLSKHEKVVCDGFPASPEHLQFLPAGSVLTLVNCNETERERRLTQRAEDTSRAWTPGIPSQRDALVQEVFAQAFKYPIKCITFDNNGPLRPGQVILDEIHTAQAQSV